MKSTFFEDGFLEVAEGRGFQLQNDRMLKIELHRKVYARRGCAIAWQGHVTFDYRGSGLRRHFKRSLTGEGLNLMEISGAAGADVFLGVGDRYVHVLWLEDELLTVNGANVLAFDPALEWDIARVRGLGGIFASGFTNTTLKGTGPVALTTRSKPVVLDVGERQTNIDPSSLVGWSAGLQPNLTVHDNVLFRMLGFGAGQMLASSFRGQGWVLVENSPTLLR